MTGDPWGVDELPAVPEADLQPLPPVLAQIAAATEDGTRLPFGDPSGTDRPGAADLPEVQALSAQGWEPLPGGLGSDVGLVPAVWPLEHRCWVHDRVPPFGVCSYGPGETFIEGGWIGFGTGRDELDFGVVDPPGTRGSAAATGWDGIPDHLPDHPRDDLPDDGPVG